MNELALFNSFFNHALNDTMGDFNFGTSFNVPKVDVKETKDAYMLEMDLPGMTEKDVNVELRSQRFDHLFASRREKRGAE